ncbi:MAG TPA: response regulator, partial [Gemmatimonadales bacterium]|nr:response regulator [Gemmatimonadales bacterium]
FILAAYFFALDITYGFAKSRFAWGALWALGYLIVSVGYVAMIVVRPGISPPRRIAAMITDMTTLSALMYFGREAGSPLYPIYLWITFGNGFRYGNRYLAYSALVSLAGFVAVVAATSYWRGQPHLAGGLIFGLMALPAYIATLIRKLTEATARAEHANQAKSRFLAVMSHELRTPLNAIIGYSEMLEEESEERGLGEIVPDLQKIRSAGKHLLSLINDVLDLSKIEAGRTELFVESFDTGALVKDIATTVRPLLDRNANRLEVHCAADVGTMQSDQTKLRQVLLNLLSNAGKFTERGVIALSVWRVRDADGDWMNFVVRDSGVGMTDEQIGRVFEAFAQADASITRRYGGTGLGLAITRRFCHMMGGEIAVESRPGAGSTFSVRLPAAMALSEPSAGAAGRVTAAADDAPTVLVIDDDPNVLELLRRILGREGYRVATALTGEAGLALARELEPTAITLDVLMPGTDGWTVLGALKADPALAAIPVVMLTMLDDAAMGYAFGASEFLTKPVDRVRLLQVLAQYRDGGRENVLVVEDDVVTRELLVRTLEQDGWSVSAAQDGREGLEAVARVTPRLIVLDLVMPELDGFEFVEALRRNPAWRGIPVVVVTAKVVTDEDRRRLNGSVERIVQKGAQPVEALLEAIRDAVAARTPGMPG